jgi:hypothetical protein
MKIHSTIALTLLLAAAACGDDGGTTPTPDMAAPDIGFNKPTAPLKANMNNAEVGLADLTCLNTATPDVATTMNITLNTTVKDFQNDTPVPNAMVTAFKNLDINAPFATVTADSMGKLSITIPMDTKRFGFKMKDPASLDTLLLNQIFIDPTTTPQTFGSIDIISMVTGSVLPTIIGKSRTPGTGVLAGAVRDCQGRLMSNFIATVSSSRGTVTHLAGADSYYFDAVSGFPVRHTVRASAAANGLFMVIEMQPTATGYVQVWGYPTEADLAGDQLKLIAELQAPVIADTVITGSYEPLRTGQ